MAQERILLVVGTECDDPGKEAEFSKWYNEFHLPEVCEFPGVLSGSRYETLQPEKGVPPSLVLYEIDGESGLQAFNARLAELQAGKGKQFTPGPSFHLVWYKAFKRVAP